MTLTIEEYQFGFVWCFLSAWIGVMHYQGDHRGAVVLLLVLLLSVTWLGWCLAVFSTVTYWFSFCYYFWVHLHPSILIPSAIDIWGWVIFCCGVVLCPVGCLVSTDYKSGASPYLGQQKKVFRCCQIPLGQGGGCVCKIVPNWKPLIYKVNT